MKTEEYKTHMSLWAILAAPLLAGNDLSTMTPETVALLTNRDVIAIDQDKAGKQGDRVWTEGPIEIWTKPLADGSKAIGIFNRHPSPMTTQVDLGKLGIRKNTRAKDIWQNQELDLSANYTVAIPGHGVVLLRTLR
jgi:alpha-galactosidase